MAGKSCKIAPPPLGIVLDEISKNTWIDFACSLAIAELGEDTSPELLLEWIIKHLVPVVRARADRLPDLRGRLDQWSKVVPGRTRDA